jgi:Cu-Zn family superoxide dismutase
MRGLRFLSFGLIVSMSMMFACGSGADSEPAAPAAGLETLPTVALAGATVELQSKSGSSTLGTALFSQRGTGADGAMEVTLMVELRGAPAGEHAVHIHEIGDCSSDDGKSAGGHWNPAGVDHGQWGEDVHHLGDIGNLLVGEDGTGSLTMTTDRWMIGDGSTNDVVGHAIIVHAGVDDFVTQPTGAAGGRISCGVIVAASAE